jgi:hypothetical protein
MECLMKMIKCYQYFLIIKHHFIVILLLFVLFYPIFMGFVPNLGVLLTGNLIFIKTSKLMSNT